MLFNITALPLIYFISILPFPLLYLLSDLSFLLVYFVIGYRKKVVDENLEKSFPEKSEKERLRIRLKFYRHFCDVIFETLKLATISKKAFRRRCELNGDAIAAFRKHFAAGRSIVGVMGHCGNWEWGAIAHQVYFDRMITGVYHPLSNEGVDRFMKRLRGRFGGDITPMRLVYRRLLGLKQAGIPTTVGLIADQTPPPESAYWTTFLNQDTPVFNGPEKLARKFGYPVLYLRVTKKKRGYYRLEVKEICEDPAALPEGAVSELHTRALEENIREQPAYWLWSHRRWKHKRPA